MTNHLSSEDQAVRDILTRKFDPDTIQSRQGPGNTTLHYIDARQAMERMDEAFGNLWNSEFITLDRDNAVVECTIIAEWPSGAKQRHADVGYPGNSDDPYKGAYSDALKRACVRFGVGRHLYTDPPGANAPQRRQTGSQGNSRGGSGLQINCPEHGLGRAAKFRDGTIHCTRKDASNEWCKYYVQPDQDPLTEYTNEHPGHATIMASVNEAARRYRVTTDMMKATLGLPEDMALTVEHVEDWMADGGTIDGLVQDAARRDPTDPYNSAVAPSGLPFDDGYDG